MAVEVVYERVGVMKIAMQRRQMIDKGSLAPFHWFSEKAKTA